MTFSAPTGLPVSPEAEAGDVNGDIVELGVGVPFRQRPTGQMVIGRAGDDQRVCWPSWSLRLPERRPSSRVSVVAVVASSAPGPRAPLPAG
jgi:hypothetical protein